MVKTKSPHASTAYGHPVFQNETNPGVPPLLLEQGVKECPASLSPKAAARADTPEVRGLNLDPQTQIGRAHV